MAPYIIFYSKNVARNATRDSDEESSGLRSYANLESQFEEIKSEMVQEKLERENFQKNKKDEMLKKRETKKKEIRARNEKPAKKLKVEEPEAKPKEAPKMKAISEKDLDLYKSNLYWNRETKNEVEDLKQNFKNILGRQTKQKNDYDLDYDKGKLKKVKTKSKKSKGRKLNFEKFVKLSDRKKQRLVERRDKSKKKRTFKKRYSRIDQ